MSTSYDHTDLLDGASLNREDLKQIADGDYHSAWIAQALLDAEGG